MTHPAAGPGPGHAPFPEPAVIEAADPREHRLPPGPARAAALAAAGLGFVIYLLGFVGEVSVTSSFGGPLLLAGGLLAGVAVLPRVGRVIAPAAVVTTVGALLLLQFVLGVRGPLVLVVAMVLAVAQTTAVVGALLLDVGLVGGDRRGRPGAAFGPLGPAGYGPGAGDPGGRGLGGYRPGGAGSPGPGLTGGYGPYAGPTAAIGHIPPPGAAPDSPDDPADHHG